MHTIEELHAERSRLVEKRNVVIDSLSRLKLRKGDVSSVVYEKTRALLVNEDRGLSQQIAEMNQQIRETHRRNNPDDRSPSPVVPVGALKPIISELAALRDHYQQFAADRTRLRSVRDMSAEFAEKLTRLIREAIH